MKLAKACVVVFVGAFLSIPGAFANFVFPLPPGKQQVTNDYHGHNVYLHFPQFSLDFQAGEIPEDVQTSEKRLRCYSYGEPILAAREGKVVQVVSEKRRHEKEAGYGTHVRILHDDGSLAIYAHMIFGTNVPYVKVGDRIQAGEIIGLMGDTGNIQSAFEKDPCEKDQNFGTHLHYEIRHLKDSLGRLIPSEPLGGSENSLFKTGQSYVSTTAPVDSLNIYSQLHAGMYPYVLKLEKVHSITPLQLPSGGTVQFELTGENLSDRTSLKIPFCSSQSFEQLDERHALIWCQTSGSGLKEGVFPNGDQSEGVLKYQVEFQTSSSGSPSISELNYVTVKPGELMNFHLLGKNLPGNLKVRVQAVHFPGEEGRCDTKDSFSFLSPGSIKTRCRIPLNLGPVDQKNEQPFTITVSHNGQVLLQKDFSIHYGISAANLLPRAALYYTPTRFIIGGKNVHRTTVFYIEGCDKKDLRIISQKYDELVLECLIQPKPGTDLSTLKGKTFPHLFLFKTQSRFDEQGQNIYNDEEDRRHVVVSGYIDVTYDKEEKIESISPAQAVIGKETIFTVTGKNLPYGTEEPKLYSVWLEYCSHGSKGLRIIPESYTPYGFDFQCTPELNKTVANGKSDFSLEKVLDKCDTILDQNWSEEEKNLALEKCYETDNPAVKKSMWGYFDRFFETLSARKFHVKKADQQQKVLVSEQSVKYVSGLYDYIKNEEAFLFQYERKDGQYDVSGPAQVKKVLPGEITRKNRHQTITVLGEHLPRSLELVSDECAQKAVTYGSSEHFEFVCLLEKVPVQEIRIIDGDKQAELSRTYTDLVEVYEAEAFSTGGTTRVHLRGVNFTPDMTLASDHCGQFKSVREPSSTEMVYSCELSIGMFSSTDALHLKVTSVDSIVLYDGKVKIGPKAFAENIPDPIVPPREESALAPARRADLILADTPVIDSQLIRLLCEANENDVFFLGECRMYSDFIREAFVNASYDKQVRLAVMEGSFDTRLGKAVDDFAANKLLGLKLNPASGNGLIILDIDDQSLLMNGEVQAIGFDATEVLGFPFAFDLYDYQGQLIVTYPYFDVNKARVKSKIVFGIGQVPDEHITLFKKESDALKKKIEENMKAINVALNKKKIEIGAKLIGSIENTTLKKLARTSYIKILKALEIVPEAVGFYDNFDFIAKGKLKSEPFRPKSWPENTTWALEANLATVDVDFVAKDGKLMLKGDALNSLSLLNNDILKTDRGLINLGLTIALNEDDGRIDLDQVEVRLPGDFASAKADAHVVHILKPEDLSIAGNIESQIGIGPFKLAEAGAGFLYDPNLEYSIGTEKTLGLLQLESQMKMVALLLAGKAVFTLPEREALVMDIGGSLSLDFLGFNQRLADILGRGRIHEEYMRGCFNSETAKVEIKIPYYARLPLLAITSNDTITFHGGFSADTQVDFEDDDIELSYFAMSGQANDDTRIGFRYDSHKNWLSAFSVFEDVCHDVPGKDFLENILPRMKAHEAPQLASTF